MDVEETQKAIYTESEYEAPMFIVIGSLSEVVQGSGGNDEDGCTGGHWQNDNE